MLIFSIFIRFISRLSRLGIFKVDCEVLGKKLILSDLGTLFSKFSLKPERWQGPPQISKVEQCETVFSYKRKKEKERK